jgi:hypothetical protein
MFVMDTRDIVPDPCDNRIIRFSNCMQCLSSILNCLAMCIEQLRDVAEIVDLIAGLILEL